jgi:hypothetical protein
MQAQSVDQISREAREAAPSIEHAREDGFIKASYGSVSFFL